MVGAEAQKFESDGYGFNLRNPLGVAYDNDALRDSLWDLMTTPSTRCQAPPSTPSSRTHRWFRLYVWTFEL